MFAGGSTELKIALKILSTRRTSTTLESPLSSRSSRNLQISEPTCGSTTCSSPRIRRRPGCLRRSGALRRRFPGQSVRSCGPRRVLGDLRGDGEGAHGLAGGRGREEPV